jgi:hypothetical protein
MTMTTALTIFSGSTDEAKKAKAQRERAGAEARIVELQARRMARFVEDDSVAAVDQIDQAIAAERRTIEICTERLAVIDASLKQRARERREENRRASIRVIARMLARRDALAVELVARLKGVAEIYEQLADDRALKKSWHWPHALSNSFSFQIGGLGQQIMYALRRAAPGMIPESVKQAIGWPGAGTGIMQAMPTGPRLPDDLPSIVKRNPAFILETLRTARIQPLEPDPADDAEEAA